MSFFRLPRTVPIIFVVTSLFPLACSALNMPEMEKTLRAQKILSPGMKVTTSLNNSTLQFSIFPDKDMKESTNTLKIRAVLLAKNLMGADKALQRVDVRFHEKESQDKFTEITVRSVDVKAFGAGITTEDELFNSLQVNESHGSNQTDKSTSLTPTDSTSESTANKTAESTGTTDGARKEERAKLAGRVQALKSKGVGIKPFLTQIEALDTLAKSGDSPQLSEKLEQMDSSITDQEKVLADRERANAPVRPEVPARVAAVPNPAVGLPGAVPGSVKNQLATMLSQSKEGAPLMRFFEGFARDAREKYGIDPDLIPEAGPYLHERWNLGLQIKFRREKGLADAIMPLWFQCQELAKTNDKAQVGYKMQNIAKAMRLPDPIARADWYQSQMDLYKDKFRKPHT